MIKSFDGKESVVIHPMTVKILMYWARKHIEETGCMPLPFQFENEFLEDDKNG